MRGCVKFWASAFAGREPWFDAVLPRIRRDRQRNGRPLKLNVKVIIVAVFDANWPELILVRHSIKLVSFTDLIDRT